MEATGPWVDQDINLDAACYAETARRVMVELLVSHGIIEDTLAQARWYDMQERWRQMGLQGCTVVSKAGLQRIFLETDYFELVQLWEKMKTQRSVIGSVLTEIKELRLVFSGFVFKFASRNCNKVTHLLAKQVTDTHRSEMWQVMSDLCP